MRDFSNDHSALALNTATLGHNLDGFGAGWTPEQVVDVCAEKGLGGITFWRREFAKGSGYDLVQAQAIGDRVRSSGMKVAGLCRTPFIVGPLAPKPDAAMIDDFKAAIDLAEALQAPCLTICVGGVIEGFTAVILR